RNLHTKLIHFAPRFFKFFLKPPDGQRNVATGRAKIAGDAVNESLCLLKAREGICARDGAYASCARSDRLVAGDFEQAYIARRAHVRSAATLFREDVF